MTQPWRATNNSLQIDAMPFYWRLSESSSKFPDITQQLPIRVTADEQFDYLKFEPTDNEWAIIDEAYRQNENIGFLNPDSGQMATYGASVNNFFLKAIRQTQATRIFEIGCGAGYSICFLRDQGYNITGIDPSEYSLHWSERLGFNLINDFFREGLVDENPNFIYCNDVFEHVRDVAQFSRMVYDLLDNDGAFCIATTNSTRSIAIGDISMFEHQHVNMFTERSLRLILRNAGFSDVDIMYGTYGNTFHVIATKTKSANSEKLSEGLSDCAGYFERASLKINSFRRYYMAESPLHCYVPLRCIPYLATVGDYGRTPLYDSNAAWRSRFIDGYNMCIRSLDDIKFTSSGRFFVGSTTFYDEIFRTLIAHGYPSTSITSIESLS